MEGGGIAVVVSSEPRRDNHLVRIGRVPQAVSDEIKGQYGDNNENTRNQQPWILDNRADVLARLEERAPTDCRRANSETQKTARAVSPRIMPSIDNVK